MKPKKIDFFAIGSIMKFRVVNEFGSIEMRSHKTPELNFDASSPKNLIFWEKTQCYELIFMCKLNKNETMKYEDIPMKVSYFPIHTQSTEGAVKRVSIASAAVFGHEKRDGYIRPRMSNARFCQLLRVKRMFSPNFKNKRIM